MLPQSGNVANSISDHLTQFLLVLGKFTGVQPHRTKEKTSFHNSDPKTFKKQYRKH